MASKYVVALAALCIFGSMCGAQSATAGNQGPLKTQSAAGFHNKTRNYQGTNATTLNSTSSTSASSQITSAKTQTNGSRTIHDVAEQTITTISSYCSSLQAQLNILERRLSSLQSSPVGSEITKQKEALTSAQEAVQRTTTASMRAIQEQRARLDADLAAIAEEERKLAANRTELEKLWYELTQQQQAQVTSTDTMESLNAWEAQLLERQMNLTSRMENLEIREGKALAWESGLLLRNRSLSKSEADLQELRQTTMQNLETTVRTTVSTEVRTTEARVTELREELSQFQRVDQQLVTEIEKLEERIEEIRELEVEIIRNQTAVECLNTSLEVEDRLYHNILVEKHAQMMQRKGELEQQIQEWRQFEKELIGMFQQLDFEINRQLEREHMHAQSEVQFEQRQKTDCKPQNQGSSTTRPIGTVHPSGCNFSEVKQLFLRKTNCPQIAY